MEFGLEFLNISYSKKCGLQKYIFFLLFTVKPYNKIFGMCLRSVNYSFSIFILVLEYFYGPH